VDAKFDNWGRTVSNIPKDTYIPTTVAQVQAIVKNAKAQGKRVRASGYRHTWSNMYSQTDHILISMLNLGLVNNLPNPESIWETPDYRDNEFKTIELAVNPDDPNKALVRLGAAVTNEDFRRWATNLNQWTVALNVIMVELVYPISPPRCFIALAYLTSELLLEAPTRPSVMVRVSTVTR
jgi:FAD/FMN-containing dehydrogenase